MILWVSKVIGFKRPQNVVRTSVRHAAVSRVPPFSFLTSFAPPVICDLNRCTETQKHRIFLYVIIPGTNIKAISVSEISDHTCSGGKVNKYCFLRLVFICVIYKQPYLLRSVIYLWTLSKAL